MPKFFLFLLILIISPNGLALEGAQRERKCRSLLTDRPMTRLLEAQGQAALSDEDRAKVVVENLPLVHSVAREFNYKYGWISSDVREDFIQWGSMALMESVKSYAHTHGARFSTFARYRVRGAMMDYFRSRAKHLRELSTFGPDDDEDRQPLVERLPAAKEAEEELPTYIVEKDLDVKQLIAQLPPPVREYFELWMQGLVNLEIAQRLRITQSMADNLWVKGLSMLRERALARPDAEPFVVNFSLVKRLARALEVDISHACLTHEEATALEAYRDGISSETDKMAFVAYFENLDFLEDVGRHMTDGGVSAARMAALRWANKWKEKLGARPWVHKAELQRELVFRFKRAFTGAESDAEVLHFFHRSRSDRTLDPYIAYFFDLEAAEDIAAKLGVETSGFRMRLRRAIAAANNDYRIQQLKTAN